jgi:hypothetical protein
MLWTYVMRAGTGAGSLRMAMGRWMVLGAVMGLHLGWNGCIGRLDGVVLRFTSCR